MVASHLTSSCRIPSMRDRLSGSRMAARSTPWLRSTPHKCALMDKTPRRKHFWGCKYRGQVDPDSVLAGTDGVYETWRGNEFGMWLWMTILHCAMAELSFDIILASRSWVRLYFTVFSMLCSNQFCDILQHVCWSTLSVPSLSSPTAFAPLHVLCVRSERCCPARRLATHPPPSSILYLIS